MVRTADAEGKGVLAVMDDVVRLRRDDEKAWADIAEELNIGQGKAMYAYMIATTPDREKIKWKTEEDLAAKVVKARDAENQSWGMISARTSPLVAEGRVKSLYEKTTGKATLGLRIGKGGRYPTEGDRPASPAKKASGPATKATKSTRTGSRAARAAAAAETSGAPKGDDKKPLADWTVAELKGKFNGKTISVYRGEGQSMERISVKNVKSTKDGEINITDQDGKARTVLAINIKKVTK